MSIFPKCLISRGRGASGDENSLRSVAEAADRGGVIEHAPVIGERRTGIARVEEWREANGTALQAA